MVLYRSLALYTSIVVSLLGSYISAEDGGSKDKKCKRGLIELLDSDKMEIDPRKLLEKIKILERQGFDFSKPPKPIKKSKPKKPKPEREFYEIEEDIKPKKPIERPKGIPRNPNYLEFKMVEMIC